MSYGMTPPDPELCRKLLGLVPFRDRLPAGRLLPPVGLMPSPLRGLREAYLLLAPDERSLPGINLAALADWVERVIGDGELAAAVREETRAAECYVDGCLRIYALVGERLEQARNVLGSDPA